MAPGVHSLGGGTLLKGDLRFKRLHGPKLTAGLSPIPLNSPKLPPQLKKLPVRYRVQFKIGLINTKF